MRAELEPATISAPSTASIARAEPSAASSQALIELGHALEHEGYEFVTVTPATHVRALRQRGSHAVDLRDVFGWNRPFDADLLPARVLEPLRAAGACRFDGRRLRSTVRFSTVEGQIFAHSAFPTVEHDAVFLGPGSYRFAAAVLRHAPHSQRIVDVGCGAGVGGILVASRARQLVLADVNDRALWFTRVNAALAGVSPRVVHSDVLDGVDGEIDLVIANPPYVHDPAGRLYRDGGGELGEGLAVRIVRDALQRLAPGGSLILHTGTAIVDGCDIFLRAVAPLLDQRTATVSYEELDPDVFGEELDDPEYVDVERIAAVLLRVTVD